MSAYSGSLLTPTSTGSLSVNLGFQPNLIIFFGGQKVDPEGTSTEDISPFYGFAAQQVDLSIGQAVSYLYCKGGSAATSSVVGSSETTNCIHTLSAVTPTDLFKASLTSFDSNGFTLNFNAVDASARRVYFIAYALDGALMKVGSFTSPSSATTKAVTGVGFSPQGAIFLVSGSERSAVAFFSGIGFDDGTNHVSMTMSAETGITGSLPGNRGGSCRATNLKSIVRQNPSGASGTIIYQEASIQSLDADGFTLNFTTSSTTTTIYYLAIQNAFFAPGSTNRSGSLTTNLPVTVSFQPDGLFAFAKKTSSSDSLGVAGFEYECGAIGSTNLSACNDCYNYIAKPGGSIIAATTSIYAASGGALIDSGDAAEFVNFVDFNSTGFDVAWVTGVATAALWYVAIGANPAFASGGFTQIIDDMEIDPLGTHYMTIGHKNSGVGIKSWTMTLFQNGQVVLNPNISLQENPSGTYTFSFANDGTNKAIYSLIVYETALTTTKYTQTWKVVKQSVQQVVNQIRSRMDSDGGFIGGS